MRNGLPYYKAYPRDFIEGTIGMPFEVKCAYRVVLDLIYMQGGNLPDDARYISGLLGCSLRKWSAIREALIEAGKLRVNGEFLSNYRADKELETLSKLQDIQRENASGSRKNKGLEKPPQRQPEPEPEPLREVGKPTSCGFDEFWKIWPVKIGKDAARKAWSKRPQQDRIAAVESAAEWFTRWQQANPRASPIHPASFLNQRRWTDEAVPLQHPQFTAIPGGRDERFRQSNDIAREFARRIGSGEINLGPDPSNPFPRT